MVVKREGAFALKEGILYRGGAVHTWRGAIYTSKKLHL